MTTIISNDITATGSAVTESTTPGIVSGDHLIIEQNATITSTGDRGILSMNVDAYQITLDGDIVSREEGISFRNNDATSVMDFDFNIRFSGSIVSERDFGIEVYNDGGNTAVTGDITIANAGYVASSQTAAMFLGSADTINLTNTGLVESTTTLTFFANAIRTIGSQTVNLTNSGTIQNASSMATTTSGFVSGVAAISLEPPSPIQGSVATVINSGTITGGSHSFYSAMETTTLTNNGTMNGHVQIDAFEGIVTLRNNGTINGDVLMGDNDRDRSTDELRNTATGTITGDIFMRDGDDFLINAGHIAGSIDMGRGNDLLNVVNGTVGGSIDLGGGNDTVVIDDTSILIADASGIDEIQTRVTWTLSSDFENLTLLGNADGVNGTGNASNNLITGNTKANVLSGLEGNDELNGQGGNDTLWGGIGNDTLRGANGSDYIYGEDGNDVIGAGAGADRVEGGIGNDTINGQAGIDWITGGEGRDVLSGGTERDLFIFNDIGETSAFAAHADRILDFVGGEDRLDLRNMIEGQFDFIGGLAFSGSGDAELRVGVNGGGHSVVYLDTNGDGTSDGIIYLMNFSGLSTADLLL